ncbi:GNAT family N-acetyltransferase [Dyella tabacisoli]|uniref:N-acetyltransferase n=1 Tax=Dyella tabacisoli TaxID=2282381 RepID=A0A369USH0_9GAMM|nr:GNAT family protein [Dyella tabacisoli]RDD81279.1 N-acetyltransferase [Dyella tabacisoli]
MSAQHPDLLAYGLNRGNLHLRLWHEDDAAALVNAVQESMESIGRWLAWCIPDYSAEDARHWIELTRESWQGRGDECALAITDKQNGELIGCIAINQFRPEHRMANIGYWVRQSRQGRGSAAKAIGMLAPYAFAYFELQRLEIVVAVENLASRCCAERAGAYFEGIARQRLSVRGQWQDAHMYSLLPSDFA